MAIVKIKNIKSVQHLSAALDYAENENKTLMDTENWLKNTDKYITDDNKTLNGRLVDAFNCDVLNTYDDFRNTSKAFNKQGGRIAYQIIQSFAPGEVAPELAHEIGCVYAKKYLSNYQVKIATHIDKNHIHNHIIFSSVSFVNGKKFHITKNEFHEQLRGISDEINREYGLSVIKLKKERSKDYSSQEKKFKEDTGKASLSEIIKKDVEQAIKNSNSLPEFFVIMQNLGYTVDTSGMYSKVKHPEAKRFFRLNTLGYCDEVLLSRITNKENKELLKKTYYYSQKKFERKKLTYVEAVYIKWLYKLGVIKKGQSSYIKVNYKEINKFDKYKKQLLFIANNNITKISELLIKEAEMQTKKKTLDVEKFKLLGAEKKFKEVFAAHAVYKRLNALQDINSAKQQEELKNAVKLMQKKGFNDFSVIDKMRNDLMQSFIKNKKDINICIEDLKEIISIKEDLPKVKSEFEKEKKENYQTKYYKNSKEELNHNER